MVDPDDNSVIVFVRGAGGDWALAAGGTTALIGARQDGDLGTSAGSAYSVGESALSGWTVYLDANDNGVLKTGEKAATSDATGAWNIRNVLPGPRVFRQVVPGGWRAVTPGHDLARRLTIAAGATTGAADVGAAAEAFVRRRRRS